MKKLISYGIIFTMILSMFSFVGVFAAEEVLIDESFEGELNGWTYANDYAKSNITVETGTAANGSKSLLFNDDSKETSPIFKSTYITATAGDVFDISASFKIAEGARVSVFYKFYDSNDKQLTGSGSVAAGEKEWKSASKTVTAPAGTVKLQLWITGTIAGIGKCYVDGVKVVRTANGSGTSATTTPATTTSSTSGSASATVTPTGDIALSESFEGELNGWTYLNIADDASITVSTAEASNGSKSLYLVDDTTAKSPILKSPYITAAEGDAFEVFADFKHETGSMFKVWYKFFDSNDKQVDGGSFGSTATTWKTMSKAIIAPSGTVKLQIWLTGVNKTTGKTYIDNLIVTKLSKEEAEAKKPVELAKPTVINGIPAESSKFHIYLCIGQSNMVGADTIANEDIVVVDGAYLYNLDGNWEVAQPYPTTGTEYMGFNRYSSVAKGSGRMGPTIGFARGMVTKVPEGVKIGIISNAIGGTTIEQWSKGFEATETRPDNDLYESAVARTKEALAKGGELKAIFWLQGESCAQKEGYMEKLVKVANGLREEIGVKNSDVPFIVSEVPQVRPNCVKVLQTAPQYIENSAVISSKDLTIFDSIHFDYDSQRKLGLRFAETALSKIYGITASAADMYKEIYGTKTEEVVADNTVYTILVNGKKLESDVPPTLAGSRLFVPIRVIFEALGATVSWDDPTQTVTGKRGDRTVVMQIGDEHMTVNGVRTAMGLAPMLKDSRTLVPIRFVGEGLGATVEWDEKTNTASITLK